MRLLPGVLKELSKHVPTVLFQTVEWSELASELPKITRRVLKKEGYQEIFDYQEEFLAHFQVVLSKSPVTPTPLLNNKWAGEKLLTLYFSQLFSPYGLFLDLRPQHFSAQNPVMSWHPTGFWITSFKAMGCERELVHAGHIITGSFSINLCKMENEDPCGPIISPALSTVVWIPDARIVSSTSRRLRKCQESSSPTGIIPPR
jgi:hypothetical protein